MITKTKKGISGTSFFGSEINATPNEMFAILGKPDFTNGDKVNIEWVRELNGKSVFTIYDWKNYGGISNDQLVDWHIGGFDVEVTEEAKKELMILISLNRKDNSFT